ncbi:transglutaminase-like cysteine peptidase [candidate division KSB1 bacterium]|nr:transglutaminase-like cysteine peptidase [candidate division KSB1 bacterium]
MKKTSTIMSIATLAAILELSSPGFTQVAIVPDKIAAFNTLLRDFDLNEDTQNGYAITEAEYKQLKTAWSDLSQADKLQLLHGSGCMLWTGKFVMALFYDLNNDKDWERHINDLAVYGDRVKGLSLTLSRFNSPMPLTDARMTLVDLLHRGSNMFSEGRLRICEEIKTQASERAGDKARQRLEKWEQMINRNQNRLIADKLKLVNDFFNRQIQAEADKGTAKGSDYWQSPIETLVRGIGDCDDFTMAKYVSLRLLGISPEQLLVAVVKNSGIGRCHAVLFFFPQNEADPWVLDNLTFKYNGLAESHILRLSVRMIRHKITPIWGINENRATFFQEDPNKEPISDAPLVNSPLFSMALINSQRLLPQTRIEKSK